MPALLDQLRNGLAKSNAEQRKRWARQIVERRIALTELLPLLNEDTGTAQRFTWLIGDVCELDPDTVKPCLPLLFSLRDEMPFPGMWRSVAKWLWRTNVPREMEREAIAQLFGWLQGDEACISSKSYSAWTLMALARQDRAEPQRLQDALASQLGSSTIAFDRRLKQILTECDALLTDGEK